MIGRAERHHRVRTRADDPDTPDVIDATPRRLLARSSSRWFAEIPIARLREEAHFQISGVGVHVTRDDSDPLAVPFPQDRSHLLLTDRAGVGDVIEVRRDDDHVADAYADGATRLVPYRRFDREVDASYVGHRKAREDGVAVQVADVRTEDVGHVETLREHPKGVVLLVDHPAANDLLKHEHVRRLARNDVDEHVERWDLA